MRRPAIMMPLLYSGAIKGTSGSSKLGTSGGRGGKLHNLASLSIDDGEYELSLLSVSLLE